MIQIKKCLINYNMGTEHTPVRKKAHLRLIIVARVLRRNQSKMMIIKNLIIIMMRFLGRIHNNRWKR